MSSKKILVVFLSVSRTKAYPSVHPEFTGCGLPEKGKTECGPPIRPPLQSPFLSAHRFPPPIRFPSATRSGGAPLGLKPHGATKGKGKRGDGAEAPRCDKGKGKGGKRPGGAGRGQTLMGEKRPDAVGARRGEGKGGGYSPALMASQTLVYLEMSSPRSRIISSLATTSSGGKRMGSERTSSERSS